MAWSFEWKHGLHFQRYQHSCVTRAFELLEGKESVEMERLVSNDAMSPLFSLLGRFVVYCCLVAVTVPNVHAQQEIEKCPCLKAAY